MTILNHEVYKEKYFIIGKNKSDKTAVTFACHSYFLRDCSSTVPSFIN